jgi:hypothetical protein
MQSYALRPTADVNRFDLRGRKQSLEEHYSVAPTESPQAATVAAPANVGL